jgi:hypothetical protein
VTFDLDNTVVPWCWRVQKVLHVLLVRLQQRLHGANGLVWEEANAELRSLIGVPKSLPLASTPLRHLASVGSGRVQCQGTERVLVKQKNDDIYLRMN